MAWRIGSSCHLVVFVSAALEEEYRRALDEKIVVRGRDQGHPPSQDVGTAGHGAVAVP